MAISEFRLYFDNQPADAERIDRIDEIRVEQAIDMVTEAQIDIPIGVDEGGAWPDIEEGFLQPLARVRIEVKVGSGDFVALIDGPIVAQRFEMSGQPNQSRAVIVVHDDSALMNREDKVRLFQELAPEDIASQVFGEYGISPEVESSGIGSAPLERVTVQRGTDIQLLRMLARETGMVAYVKPDVTPGRSIGVFARLSITAGNLPELLLVGEERNTNRLALHFDSLAPVAATIDTLQVTDGQVLTAEFESSSEETLGDESAHDIASPPGILLSPVGGGQSDLDAAAQAAVNQSSWALFGEGEVTAEAYPAVLQPYEMVSVAGAGSILSGRYLVSEVRHQLRDESYRQSFSLRRNARSVPAGGGLGAGIF
jgi:phage protein D